MNIDLQRIFDHIDFINRTVELKFGKTSLKYLALPCLMTRFAKELLVQVTIWVHTVLGALLRVLAGLLQVL